MEYVFVLLLLAIGLGIFFLIEQDRAVTQRRVEALEHRQKDERDERNKLIEFYISDREKKEQEIINSIGANKIIASIAIDPYVSNTSELETSYESYLSKIYVDQEIGLIKLTTRLYFSPNHATRRDIDNSKYEIERVIAWDNIKDVLYKEKTINLARIQSRSIGSIKACGSSYG